MRYQSDKLCLNCIQTILEGPVNDVYMGVDISVAEKTAYIVNPIKRHNVSRDFLKSCVDADIDLDSFIIEHMSAYGQDVYVFPYRARRPLSEFYNAETIELAKCEDICKSFVLACIQSGVPFSVLYMMLTQGQINIARDLSVYLTYELDFEKYDPSKGERECVVECARLLIEMLEPKASKKSVVYRLLRMRVNSAGYQRFAELYKDITIASASVKKYGIVQRAKAWWIRNKDRLFYILIVICSLALVLALAMLITQLICGDVPWLRIFANGFKRIGTEFINEQ